MLATIATPGTPVPHSIQRPRRYRVLCAEKPRFRGGPRRTFTRIVENASNYTDASEQVRKALEAEGRGDMVTAVIDAW